MGSLAALLKTLASPHLAHAPVDKELDCNSTGPPHVLLPTYSTSVPHPPGTVFQSVSLAAHLSLSLEIDFLSTLLSKTLDNQYTVVLHVSAFILVYNFFINVRRGYMLSPFMGFYTLFHT